MPQVDKNGILEIFAGPVWYAGGRKMPGADAMKSASRDQLCTMGNCMCYGKEGTIATPAAAAGAGNSL